MSRAQCVFLLLNCVHGLLVLLCCVHPFIHNKEHKDEKPKSDCGAFLLGYQWQGAGGGGEGRAGCCAGLMEVVLTFSVAPTCFPTSLSWLTGYSPFEESGLKDALLPSGALAFLYSDSSSVGSHRSDPTTNLCLPSRCSQEFILSWETDKKPML